MAVKIEENDDECLEQNGKLLRQSRRNSIVSTLTKEVDSRILLYSHRIYQEPRLNHVKHSQNHPIVCGFPKNEIGMIIACSMVSFSCYLTATILGIWFTEVFVIVVVQPPITSMNHISGPFFPARGSKTRTH